MAGIFSGAPKPFVPQHGFNSQSPAAQHLIAGAAFPGLRTRSAPNVSGRRKKKATAASAAKRGKRRRSSAAPRKASRSRRGTKAYLVKGSAAAKRKMAKLRKLRRGA